MDLLGTTTWAMEIFADLNLKNTCVDRLLSARWIRNTYIPETDTEILSFLSFVPTLNGKMLEGFKKYAKFMNQDWLKHSNPSKTFNDIESETETIESHQTRHETSLCYHSMLVNKVQNTYVVFHIQEKILYPVFLCCISKGERI